MNEPPALGRPFEFVSHKVIRVALAGNCVSVPAFGIGGRLSAGKAGRGICVSIKNFRKATAQFTAVGNGWHFVGHANRKPGKCRDSLLVPTYYSRSEFFPESRKAIRMVRVARRHY
jgi:hypothetical protein